MLAKSLLASAIVLASMGASAIQQASKANVNPTSQSGSNWIAMDEVCFSNPSSFQSAWDACNNAMTTMSILSNQRLTLKSQCRQASYTDHCINSYGAILHVDALVVPQ